MDPAGAPTQAQIEAAVRAYLARVGRRYLPLLVGAIVLVIVAVTVPTQSRQPQSPAFNGLAGTGGNSTTTNGTTGPSGATGPQAAGVSGGGTAAVGTTGSNSGPGAAGQGGAVPTGPVAPSTSGIARSGVHCGAGKRQVTWSVYAPPCVAKYTGNNGGATARGVTANTITLSYRVSTSADDAAISAATGSAAPP
ncbi:MAG TPA: hypothetical protein VFH54_20155, partial [Mycobacteriales bacterium]|nr:hypothetical protein [Mycobacteriales bacterium]